MDCLTLGEPLMCFDSGDEPLDATSVVRKHIAGAEGNVAIGLARLGRSVGYIGRVGRDSLGREIVRTLRGEGVDVSRLTAVDDAPTGLLLKERLDANRTAVTYYRAGSAGSTLTNTDLPESIDGVRRLHVSGITLVLSASAREAMLEAMRRARAAGCRVSLDANFRQKLASSAVLVETFEQAAALADEIILGRGEAAICAGGAETERLEAYARSLAADVVVLKGQAGGATGFIGGERIECEPLTVPVVDAVGAGDGFAVGFIDALLECDAVDTTTLAASLERGGRVAARVVARQGDYQGLPFRDDLAESGVLSGVVVR